MARICSICAHKSRKQIDEALVRPDASIRGIARTFRVSEDALSRHVKGGHIEQKIAKAQQAQDIVEANDLLNQIEQIHTEQKTIYKEARGESDNHLALQALRDQSKVIELKGKVLGAFKDPKHPSDGKSTAAIIAPLSPDAAKKIGDIIAENI